MTPPSVIGYSGTPLAKKLGDRQGSIAFHSRAPAEYKTWLQPLPPGVEFASRLGTACSEIWSGLKLAIHKELR